MEENSGQNQHFENTHTEDFLTRQSDLKVHILKDHKRIAKKILKKNGKQRRLAQILNSIIKLQ